MAAWTSFYRPLKSYGPVDGSGYSWTAVNHLAWTSMWEDPASTGSLEITGHTETEYYRSYQDDYCTPYSGPNFKIIGPYKGGFKSPDTFDGYLIAKTASAKVYGIAEYGQAYSKLRIQNLDGSKWVEAWTVSSTSHAYVTSSVAGVGGSQYASALDNYTDHILLEVNVDGSIRCRFYTLTTYSNSCYGDTNLYVTIDTGIPCFDVNEPLIAYYIFDVPDGVTFTKRPYWWYVSGEFLDPENTPVLIWWETADLQPLEMTGSISQDNDIPEGVLEADWSGNDSTFFDELWEMPDDGTYVTIYTTSVRLYVPSFGDRLDWGARLKIGFKPNENTSITSGQSTYAFMGLMNADGSRSIMCGQTTDRYFFIKTEVDGVSTTVYYSETSSGYTSVRQHYFEVKDGILKVIGESYDGRLHEYECPVTDIFGATESFYHVIRPTLQATYTSLYNTTIILSPQVAHNVDYGQTANILFAPMLEPFDSNITELTTKRFCFYKTKIKNSKNVSDLTSLYGIDPGYPSDSGVPIQIDDGCIVHEKYNRFYFYSLVAGDEQNSLPDIIRATPTLYWKLVDVVTNNNLLIEQYDIVGLVSGSEVIVTHSAHNREKSFAPTVQMLHNNVIKTKGIVIAIVSNTQLRLSTSEVTEFTNLKINIHVTI